MANPLNVIYDFIPATGKAVAAADLDSAKSSSIASCNECHEKLAFTAVVASTRNYCVVCHTDQRKYGNANVDSTSRQLPGAHGNRTVNATTGITSYSLYTGDDGRRWRGLRQLHDHGPQDPPGRNAGQGELQLRQRRVRPQGLLDARRWPEDVHQVATTTPRPRRPTTGTPCRAGWPAAPATTASTSQPAGVDAGRQGADSPRQAGWHDLGSRRRRAVDDSICTLCHNAADIKIYHQTANVTKHNPTIAAGLANFTYEIKSAAVNATTNDVTIKFRILQPLPQHGHDAGDLPCAGTPMANPLTGFTGAPSFLLA